ncbi:DUF1565 domain-containing protein [Leptolyngbya sp. GB1-A1]|uniref:DUF1565 domain-containing protein n=1 Tax=Leptolyngbya sp. GB1-A1 TaxID=2933908 RepID=UPI003296ED79
MRLMTSRAQSGSKAQKSLLPFLDAGLTCTRLTCASLTIALTLALLNGWNNAAAAQIEPSAPGSLSQRNQTFLFVNPAIGQDIPGSGSQQLPFRTIHHALQVAQPNTVILLSPGLYSAETGEVFPLQMRSGITIQGDSSTAGQGIVIRGGGEFVSSSQGSQNVTLIGAMNTLLTGITITNPQGHGLWIESSNPMIAHNTFSGSQASGITVTGNALAAIQQNRFRQNQATGLLIAGTAQPEVRQNFFEQAEVGITIAQSAAPLIVQNQIRRNRTGVLVQDSAHPVLRRNAIEHSSEVGVAAVNNAQPDLGTAEDAGQNQFRQNRRQDVNAASTSQTVPIAGNQLSAQQVSGRVDFDGIVTQIAAVQADQGFVQPAETGQTPELQSIEMIHPADPSALSAAPIPPTPVSASIPSASTVSTDFTDCRSTLVATALIGQLPPREINADRSIAAPRFAVSGSLRADHVSPTQNSAQPEAIAEADPAVSIPIPVPPPENSGVRMSPADSLNLPPEALMPSLMPSLPSSSEPVLMAAVPVSVPFRAPQPFAAGIATPFENSSPAIPVMQSSLSLPAPPPLPQLAAVPSAQPEIDDRLTLQSNVLPVPDGDAPIGNTGDMPRINVSAGQSWNAGSAVSSPERSMLRYRVVVEAGSERVQALVRSLIPSAFLISGRGRPLMQVGAFSDRDNAEDAARLLNQSGLRAVIQRL